MAPVFVGGNPEGIWARLGSVARVVGTGVWDRGVAGC